jgi:pilus assembly protein CpaC
MKILTRIILTAFFLLPGFTANAAPKAVPGANGISVEINKGTIVRLPGQASVVAVANPEIADVEVMSPELISVQGRDVGQTSVVAFNEQGDEILNETVTVTHNLTRLNNILKSVMPGSKINFSSVDGALVMTGEVESPLEADQARRMVDPFLNGGSLVNMLAIKGSDQVMLQVRVAEVSRTEMKRFGINLGAALNAGNFAFGLFNGRNLATSLRSPNLDGAIIGQYDGDNFDLDSVIDALAEDNIIKVLAEPNLTTTSGKSANFLAGGEFPIPVPGQDGQVTIEFREYGISLRFTPVVLSREKISLTVAPEVSELSQIGAIEVEDFNIPALTTRRAETTVELGSGQSFAIAGLLQHNNSNNVSKFPGLGDLPIIGALFRSTEYRNDQTELMIFVTPYLVRATSAHNLTDPTAGYISPSEAERIGEGKHYHPTPEPQAEKPAVESEPRNLSPREARNRRGRGGNL